MLPRIYFFDFSIQTYWLMMGVGFLAMLLLMMRRRKLYGFSPLAASMLTVLVMVSGVVGCKVLYILENLKVFFENGISMGGFSFFGAVFLIPISIMLFHRAFSKSVSSLLDAVSPCVALMITVMRVGCFLNGCCGGSTVEVLGYSFKWPTQAMESIGDTVILLWLLEAERENRNRGQLYPMFLFSYGVLRFLIEFFRDTPKNWLWLSHGQWFSILAVLIAGACSQGLRCKKRKWGGGLGTHGKEK